MEVCKQYCHVKSFDVYEDQPVLNKEYRRRLRCSYRRAVRLGEKLKLQIPSYKGS